MFSLQISPEAKNDLITIKNYVSQELGSPQADIKRITKIPKRIRGLTEHPEIGASLTSIVDLQTDYRFLVCASYLILYKYESGVVFVSRILYGRRNYTHILFGDLHDDQE
jgi:toxin ParE1/3/4